MAKFHLQENETLIGSGLMACKHKKSPASQLFYINFLLKIVGETPARRARREITKASPSAICGCALGRLGISPAATGDQRLCLWKPRFFEKSSKTFIVFIGGENPRK